MESMKRVVTGQGLEEESGEGGVKWIDWKKRRRGRT